jgi:hypothetical protein
MTEGVVTASEPSRGRMPKLSDYSTIFSDLRPAPGPRGCRDRELVHFVGRHGVVAIDHVMAALEMGRTAAYRRVADLLRNEASALRATCDGLRYADLGLKVAAVSPGGVNHWLRCASTARLVGEHFGHDRILTERELELAERIEWRPIASAIVGEHRDGRPRLHRPDLAVLTDEGVIAIEVELTPKTPRRLETIIRGWRTAACVSEVHYFCPPGPTRRAVERTIDRVHAEKRVVIVDQAVPR